MTANWYHHETKTGALMLRLRVQPGAKRSEVIGLHEDALKLRLRAPAVEGKANAALCDFLAQAFGVPKHNVRIVSGETARAKLVEVISPARPPESLLSGAAKATTPGAARSSS